MTPDRLDPSLQGADGAVAAARDEREARLGEWESQLAAGAHPGHDQQTQHFDGQPSIAAQMKTHVPPPSPPDTGGHDDPGARIG